MSKFIRSDPLLDALRAAGIADDTTRRVVIDLKVNALPVVYIERLGDEQLLKVVEAVGTIEITKA
jgi:hypothetical protein